MASQPLEIFAYNRLSSATFGSDYDKKVESRVRCLTLMMRGWSPGSSTPRNLALTPPTGIEAGWDQREREGGSLLFSEFSGESASGETEPVFAAPLPDTQHSHQSHSRHLQPLSSITSLQHLLSSSTPVIIIITVYSPPPLNIDKCNRTSDYSACLTPANDINDFFVAETAEKDDINVLKYFSHV